MFSSRYNLHFWAIYIYNEMLKAYRVNFDNPDKLGWNSTALPLFSGKVVVSGSNGEQLSVPYMGKSASPP